MVKNTRAYNAKSHTMQGTNTEAKLFSNAVQSREPYA